MSFKEFNVDNVVQGSVKSNELSDQPSFDIFLNKPIFSFYNMSMDAGPKQVIEACGYDNNDINKNNDNNKK